MEYVKALQVAYISTRITTKTARLDGYAWQDMRTWRTVASGVYQSPREEDWVSMQRMRFGMDKSYFSPTVSTPRKRRHLIATTYLRYGKAARKLQKHQVQMRIPVLTHKRRTEATNMRLVMTRVDGACMSPRTLGQMEPSFSSQHHRRSATYHAGRTSRLNIRTLKYPLLKPQCYVRIYG
jgi:hypothetical protein